VINLPWLEPDSIDFPCVEKALKDPNGLLAAGGSLTQKTLLAAYQRGIFPWFEVNQPILWWSPSPRLVIYPDELHVSKSMRKTIKKTRFHLTTDKCFSRVMKSCAEPRADQAGTWITDDMLAAYTQLHKTRAAHSIEVWDQKELVGGLYGISLGKFFFGESMFSHRSNASKLGFIALVSALKKNGYALIDCQVHSDHLASLGAREIDRDEFCKLLERDKLAIEATTWISSAELNSALTQLQ
jgi:leucyl/phenylalanyl-tRNA--protein transferase